VGLFRCTVTRSHTEYSIRLPSTTMKCFSSNPRNRSRPRSHLPHRSCPNVLRKQHVLVRKRLRNALLLYVIGKANRFAIRKLEFCWGGDCPKQSMFMLAECENLKVLHIGANKVRMTGMGYIGKLCIYSFSVPTYQSILFCRSHILN
jgi:hypothetical protein